MGSPLGTTMANIFWMNFNKLKWLKQCPSEFEPVFYRRYVDDLNNDISLWQKFKGNLPLVEFIPI